jgi:hypothetical protein
VVLQQINGSASTNKAVYPAVAESVLEGMRNAGVPGPLATILAADPRYYGRTAAPTGV